MCVCVCICLHVIVCVNIACVCVSGVRDAMALWRGGGGECEGSDGESNTAGLQLWLSGHSTHRNSSLDLHQHHTVHTHQPLPGLHAGSVSVSCFLALVCVLNGKKEQGQAVLILTGQIWDESISLSLQKCTLTDSGREAKSFRAITWVTMHQLKQMTHEPPSDLSMTLPSKY